MNATTDILLPTEHERRQLCYWLKRISSYTAWNRVLDYHRQWVAVTEHSFQIASDKGWLETYDDKGEVNGGVPVVDVIDGKTYTSYTGTAISRSRIVSMLKALAHFEEGVKRLRQGDKRVFQRNAQGEFIMGMRQIRYWNHFLYRMEFDGAAIDEEHTPLWHEFKASLTPLSASIGECAPPIIEPFYADEYARSDFSQELRDELQHMLFPDPLPEVPESDEIVLVTTGKTVPCSGLWEPIEAPVKKGFSLFRGGDAPRGPFTPLGRMTYLHGGLPARTRYDFDCDGRYGSPCTWRLIWRDDRYEDGSIPAEEADYVFMQPEKSVVATIKDATSSYPNAPTAETGQAAPQAGRWLVIDDLNAAAVQLDAGQPLPKHNGRDVRWVLAQD